MRTNDFFRGCLVTIFITGLYQDIIYGSAQKYAEYVLLHWTDRGITIPIAIIGLIIVFVTRNDRKGGTK